MVERNDDGAWFAQKRFGYGAGLPLTWQGWALLGGYLAVMAGLVWAPHLSGGKLPGGALALILVLTVGFIELARRRTRGGWKWRWGGDE